MIVTTACVQDEPAPSPSPTVSTPPSSPTPSVDPSELEPAPSEAVDDETGEAPDPYEPPAWDDAARADAIAAADALVTAYTAPIADERAWWEGVAPLLSRVAQTDYQYVDPANVPDATLTGGSTSTDESVAGIARVDVPTSVGTWQIVLSRQTLADPWLGEQITPPEGIG